MKCRTSRKAGLRVEMLEGRIALSSCALWSAATVSHLASQRAAGITGGVSTYVKAMDYDAGERGDDIHQHQLDFANGGPLSK